MPRRVRRVDRGRAWHIGAYFAALSLTSGLGDPTGLISVPVLFVLKDQLLLGPHSVAVFEAIAMTPHYLAVAFGVLRDRWSPLGLGDRGYLLIAAPVAAASYLWASGGGGSYRVLLIAIVLAMIAYQMIDAAAQAWMTAIAQARGMTGRLSALTEIMESAVAAAAMLAGGWMVGRVSIGTVFVLAAAVTMAVFAQGLWRPAAAIDHPADPTGTIAGIGDGASTLMRNRGFRLTAVALVLYNFSPGWGTPLLYFLTDQVGVSPGVFGGVRAVTFAAMAVVTVLYGVLCVRYPLKHLLRWAIVLNILPGFLFLAIRTPEQALVVSAAIGVLSGFANIALFDLLMRACPSRLEGMASMLGVSVFGLAGAAGDLAGAWLYESSGFLVCIAVDALATAIMLVPVLQLPGGLVALPDGALPMEAERMDGSPTPSDS